MTLKSWYENNWSKMHIYNIYLFIIIYHIGTHFQKVFKMYLFNKCIFGAELILLLLKCFFLIGEDDIFVHYKS